MKKIIAMIVVLFTLSLMSGCIFPGWYDGRDGRGHEHGGYGHSDRGDRGDRRGDHR